MLTTCEPPKPTDGGMGLLTIASLMALPSLSLAAAPEPYQAGDYGGFRSILPPGTNGLATATQIADFQLAFSCREQSPDPDVCPPLNYPAHAIDQLDMYGDLVYNTRIRKTVRYAEAPVKGSSVLAYDPNGDAAMLYRDLAKEVLNGSEAREHA